LVVGEEGEGEGAKLVLVLLQELLLGKKV